MALFKNKNTDKKRKGENVIGKIIYGFLLFAPLMSILFTSLYTVFNKNAVESYYGETINEVEIHEGFIDYSTYYTIYPKSFNYPTGTQLYVTLVDSENINLSHDKSLINSLIFYISNTDNYLRIDYEGYSSQYINKNGLQLDSKLSFYINTRSNNDLDNYLFSYTYNKYSYLDNAFEYGMYKTEQSNIYNWSKSTGTYTVLQNVCTGIGITNTFVPMLMAYWLLISIIYFLFDIALILIWAVHDKIHALKDAI